MAARTTRLDLARPTLDDVDALHAIYADPRVWTHFPSLRFTQREQTERMVARWVAAWRAHGLGQRLLRAPGESELLGHAGCEVRDDTFVNLGYRLAPLAHGRGLATEAALAAVAEAHERRSDLPVVAYLVAHNHASARVTTKVGLTLRHAAPDFGNPDPGVMRHVYADRELTDAELAATLRRAPTGLLRPGPAP
ncbi:hypothetical protein GCM10009633_06580 [Janibacter melonis]|uniref:GNAT family N-acetyltransferase n=1 Tax=Janibacter melonis TaxID=262209 RepID=UPI001E377CCB|nr:GNAT family N-acetyltransferase [Janibacter melonis]MCB5990980.1 GNAT family N-acetyltransferase [Janibacter melonis]